MIQVTALSCHRSTGPLSVAPALTVHQSVLVGQTLIQNQERCPE